MAQSTVVIAQAVARTGSCARCREARIIWNPTRPRLRRRRRVAARAAEMGPASVHRHAMRDSAHIWNASATHRRAYIGAAMLTPALQ